MIKGIRRRLSELVSFFKGSKWRIATVLLILVMSLAIRLYWAGRKEGMHIDEVASFSIAECDGAYYSPDVQIPVNMDISGKDLKSLFFFHDTRVKGMLHDLRYMWYNVYDYNHTNFYYSLLRVFFVGSDTTDIRTIQMRGILLNMLIYVLEFAVFLCLLLVYWRKQPLLVFTGLTCFAFMAGGISNTLYIRPYELQTLMVLLLALWLTYVVRSMTGGAWRYSVRNFFITSFALAGVLWTGYFMVILVCVFGAFLLWETYRHGRLKIGFPYFIGTSLMSLLICRCLYQSYFLGFGGDQRIDNKLGGGVIDTLMHLGDSILHWGWLIGRFTICLPVIPLLVVIFILYRHKKWHLPWIVLPAMVYTAVVMCFAPYLENRYMVSATPVVLLVIPAIIGKIQNRRWLTVAASFVICIFVIWPVFKYNIRNLSEKEAVFELLDNKKHNIYLMQDEHSWLTRLVPHVVDDVTYHVRDTLLANDKLHSGDIVVWHTKKGGLIGTKSQFGGIAVSSYIKDERPCNKDIVNNSTLMGKLDCLMIYEFYVVK